MLETKQGQAVNRKWHAALADFPDTADLQRMAYVLAIFASLIVALTVTPALSLLLLWASSGEEPSPPHPPRARRVMASLGGSS